MTSQTRTYVFRCDQRWETIDTYWSSPLSFWSEKSLRLEPPLPLRIVVMGVVIQRSSQGWINYGGSSAILIQSVQALGDAGQRVRVEIFDEPVVEQELG